MRFVIAIFSLVIALIMIGFGIAQRTVFAAPDQLDASIALDSYAPITVIDGETLNAMDGRQKVEVSGAQTETVFAAYGRTQDVIAWAGDSSYNAIGFNEETKRLTSKVVSGATNAAPSAAGSDLWFDEFTREDSVEFTVNVPRDISIIIMADGVSPAPTNVSVAWPVDNRTPWAGPLIVAGIFFLLLGTVMTLWAIAHLRRTRGPRRKPPRQPKLPQRPKYNYRKATKAVRRAKPVVPNSKGRRATGRMTAILPIVLVGALALSGCSADSWPYALLGGADSSPTPSATAEFDEIPEHAPVVTVPQLKGIVAEIAVVAAQADADRDAELLESRFTGTALQLRQANYAIRKVDNGVKPLVAIPSEPVALTLPQQSDAWPRFVFTVLQDAEPATEPDATTPPTGEPTPATSPTATPDATADAGKVATVPTALMLVQESPRENYKVASAVVLEATILPDVAAADVGAVRQDPDLKFLKLPPAEVGAAYADVMAVGEKSQYFELFNFEHDSLLPSVGVDMKAKRKADMKTAVLSFTPVPDPGETIALATFDSGAIVTANIGEIETVKPKEKGAVLSPAGQVKSLSGVSKTTKGVSATYSYQLLFYVPPISSNEQIELLGFTQGLVAAKEVK